MDRLDLNALESFIARTTNPSGLPSVRLLHDFEASRSSWTAFGMNTAQVLNRGEQHAMDCAIV